MKVRIENVKQMMVQRGFKICKEEESYLIGSREAQDEEDKEYIYIKIFNDKFELKVVREFLSSTFNLESFNLKLKTSNKNVVQLVIISNSFQNSHVKEFMEVSKHIQLFRSDFFDINITKKAPKHHKIDGNLIKNKREIAVIRVDDPICLFYKFEKGDLIRVIRFDGEIGYRLVK